MNLFKTLATFHFFFNLFLVRIHYFNTINMFKTLITIHFFQNLYLTMVRTLYFNVINYIATLVTYFFQNFNFLLINCLVIKEATKVLNTCLILQYSARCFKNYCLLFDAFKQN